MAFSYDHSGRGGHKQSLRILGRIIVIGGAIIAIEIIGGVTWALENFR